MSEWITDRLPWSVDSDMMGKVWIFEDNAVYWSDYSVVTDGTPWMPIKQPAPYVKPEPKRWKPQENHGYYAIRASGTIVYVVNYDTLSDECYLKFGNCFQTQEQAEEAARRVGELLLNYHKELPDNNSAED